jgi:hypothetical protein
MELPVSSSVHIIRYLERWLSACEAWPALHRHQIAAYQRLLELARGVRDAADYHRALQARGLALDAVRAEWLDRYHHAACLHRALGDETQRGAAAMRFHAGQEPDFLAAITATEQQYAARIAAGRASQDALAPLLMSLLDWRLEADEALGARRLDEVRGLWGVIQAGDPGCTWQRICSHPPYRNRVPFDDTGLALVGDWLARALAAAGTTPAPAAGAGEPGDHDQPAGLAEPAAPAGPAEQAGGTPAAAEPAMPGARALAHVYHVIHDAQDWTGRDATRQVYERIFALEAEVEHRHGGDGDAFLCRMAEEDLFTDLARAPHIDWAGALRAHGAGRSQPVMTHHASALAAAMAACATPTAVEHERWRLDACFDVESAWDQIFVHYALRPVTAVLASSTPGARARDHIAALPALFGATWDALLATPRVWEFFVRELVPALAGQQPILGARRGEVGMAVVQAAAMAASRPARHAPADVQAHVAALLASPADLDPAPPAATPAGRAVILWGQPVALDAVLDRLAAPPRPAVALDTAGATTMSALSHPRAP